MLAIKDEREKGEGKKSKRNIRRNPTRAASGRLGFHSIVTDHRDVGGLKHESVNVLKGAVPLGGRVTFYNSAATVPDLELNEQHPRNLNNWSTKNLTMTVT